MSSGSIVFRRIDSSLINDILAIERKAFDIPWSSSMMRDSLEAAHTKVGGLFKDGKLVAFVVYAIILDEAELLSMAVAPDYQRQGLGAILLENVISHAKRKKVEKLHLELRQSNLSALKLYQKYGFEQVGERKAYYPSLQAGAREDAILMTLQLAQ
jgi:ribosomal-protein-alanine N-acetyltransferase